MEKIAEVALQGFTQGQLSYTELQLEAVVVQARKVSRTEMARQQLSGLQRHPGALAPGDGLGMETGQAL